jgi:UDP-N-acetylmuramoylalanine--D-glutamate ligase
VELNGKRVLVVGLGRSGVASALFLKSQGARVTVSDSKTEDQLRNEIPVLLDQGIAVETGGHGDRTFQNQDLIVVSPGVPVDAPPGGHYRIERKDHHDYSRRRNPCQER